VKRRSALAQEVVRATTVVAWLGLVVWGGPVAADGVEIHSDGFESGDTSRWAASALCAAYDSTTQEFSPVQIAAAGLPGTHSMLAWTQPAPFTALGPFAGVPGQPAAHEGTDYVHDDPSTPHVPVAAAADGQVAYVRLGCPQSATFTPNLLLRECGAGWGNHVVVLHGWGTVTRYAHLAPGSVAVAAGNHVARGQILAEMGNSGRSDVRHLHLELGSESDALDPCTPAQSFDLVYDPEGLPWSGALPTPEDSAGIGPS